MRQVLRNFIDYVELPDEISEVERQHTRHVNRIGFFFFLAHPPVIALVAWACGTGVFQALWMSTLIVVGPAIACMTFDNPRRISLVLGVTSMCMGAALVHFGQGPMQIEMHFYFFVLLALLAMTSNPMAIIVAAVTVAAHHLLFWMYLPRSVFNYDASFWVVAVHAAFVVLESIAACYVARNFYDNVIGLEKIVNARTAELDARNDQMRLVLDNADQGMFTIDRDGTMAKERSRVVDTWLGEIGEGARFGDVLEELEPNLGAWFDVSLETVVEDAFPEELALEQMPRRVEIGARTIDMTYRPIRSGEGPSPEGTNAEAGEVQGVLVVMTDVTDQIEHDRAQRAQQEIMAIFQRVMSDRAAFLDFFNEAAEIVHALRDGGTGSTPDMATQMRQLHTLKGNCAIFGVVSIADLCHQFESDVGARGEGLSSQERAQLEETWQSFSARLGSALGERSAETIEMTSDEYEAVVEAVLGEVPRENVAELLGSLRNEPSERRLRRYVEAAETLADRLGKPAPHVEVESNGIRIPHDRFVRFWPAFAHAVRNAVDHGIEAPEVRIERGKPEAGRITLTTDVRGDEILIELTDDGGGIDWAQVACKAAERGLPHAGREDLVAALFADGFSTRAQVSTVSGRGVGMAALRAAAESSGGRVLVDSTPGEGTSMAFAWKIEDVFGSRSPYARGVAYSASRSDSGRDDTTMHAA